MDQEWVVRWSNGREMTFVPYDSIGMNSFIKKGLEQGIVTVNGREVIIDILGLWAYKQINKGK